MKHTNHIRLMVVDDHPAFRMGLIALIESQADMKVAAEIGNGLEVVETYRRAQPDVVLMDLRMPGLSGVEAIIALRKEFPQSRVIVLTTYDNDEDLFRACQSGALAYLLKDTPTEEIVGTIRAVFAGQQRLTPAVADRLKKRSKREELSLREMDVLQYLVKGRSNKEIGAALFISEDTVKSHMKSLFAKLGVNDRTGAVIVAIREGIVHLD